jgi:hypothetical protein
MEAMEGRGRRVLAIGLLVIGYVIGAGQPMINKQ